MKKKELKLNFLVHIIVIYTLILTMCLGCAISVYAGGGSWKYENNNEVIYFSQYPSEQMLYRAQLNNDLYNDQFSRWLFNHMIFKPSKPTFKPKIKVLSKKGKIVVKTNVKGPYQIKYSVNKSFKKAKTFDSIVHSKKHTVLYLKKKQKYYIKVRFIKEFAYASSTYCNTYVQQVYYDFGDLDTYKPKTVFDVSTSCIQRGQLYGPWSKTKSKKTK